jgi:hypothetical protein
MSDANEYLDDLLREARIHGGSDISPAAAATNFLRHDVNTRTKVLAELDKKIEGAHLSLLEAQKIHRYRGRLIHSHQMALKVGR